jgi:hypothetical protein
MAKSPRQRYRATTIVDLVVPSLAGLSSAVTSRTRQRQRVMGNVDLAMSSPVGLDSAVTSMGR